MFLCRNMCDPYQGDPRQDLQQRYQVVSIPQVFVQVCDVLPHLRNKKAGTGGREEKEETKEEKVNTPLQSSLCWLNTVDICQTACPTASGAGDSGCRGDREEAPAVWPLVCVAMTLPLEWLYWTGVKGLGCHLEATAADSDSAAGSASVLLWFESGMHDGADE